MSESIGRRRLSRRRLLVTLVAVMALSGLGMGLFSATAVDGPDSGVPPDAPPNRSPDATILTTVTDPLVVRSTADNVGAVNGELDGTLAIRSDASHVELVVETRLPNGTWVDIDRTVFHPGDADVVDLSTHVGGPNTTYLDPNQSGAFDVEGSGTLEHRHGAVAVTAVLYRDGEVVSRVADGERYELFVDGPAGARQGPGAVLGATANASHSVPLRGERATGPR